MTEQEKAERFYKACGFQPYVFPGRYYYDQPPTPVTGWIKDGEKPLTLLPSTSDLNALFKYAVPVAMEKVVKENKGWTVKRAYEFKPGFVKITGYCLKCKKFPEFEKEK